MMNNKARQITHIINGIASTDGAGVELTRVIGQAALPMLDPFLLLDAFRSDDPEDYIAGFPSHPHRGFETVTYLLAGKMRHKDSAGHEGVIETGGVQWMTAASGIVHSEMPEQEDGLLEGFQLWVNLPAEHKMDAPEYQEHAADKIPHEQREPGVSVKVIAGVTAQGVRGPIVQPLTDPLYLDITLAEGSQFSESLPSAHNAFIYVVDGEVALDDVQNEKVLLGRDQLAVFSKGDMLGVYAHKAARFLLIAGKPLNEPVERAGPFVMNTRQEIHQAYADYNEGHFGY